MRGLVGSVEPIMSKRDPRADSGLVRRKRALSAFGSQLSFPA